MNIVCLDMEGVLVPEIWIAFAEESGIPELRRTTRDEPDYDKLMRWRIDILRQHGLGLTDNQEKFLQNMVGDFMTRMAELLNRGLHTQETLQKLNDRLEQLRNC